MKIRILAALAVGSSLAAAPAPAQTLDETRSAAIADRAHETMERLGAPAISLAVSRDGEVVYAEGFGLARVADSVPATARTLYRTASVAKPMTATAVLSLAESGEIDLDAPVRETCPAFGEKRWPVTARQLLAHTAGVRHPTDPEDETTTRYRSVEEAVTVFAGDSLLHEPGTGSSYSTLGYMVLACAVEGATGRPFMAALEERVFEPAGMESTAPDTIPRSDERRALGYRKSPEGGVEPSLEVDTSFKLAGGGLVSNVVDLARFGGALLEGRLLRKESLETMFTPVTLADGEATPMSLGWQVGSMMGQRFAVMTGQQEEISSALMLVPDHGLVIALQSNLERHARDLMPLVVAVASLVSAEDEAPPLENPHARPGGP